MNFNPRPPCGGRRYLARLTGDGVNISIRALLAEGDTRDSGTSSSTLTFQPAPSLRRATLRARGPFQVVESISTRALLAEGDRSFATNLARLLSISTRALLAEGDSAH